MVELKHTTAFRLDSTTNNKWRMLGRVTLEEFDDYISLQTEVPTSSGTTIINIDIKAKDFVTIAEAMTKVDTENAIYAMAIATAKCLRPRLQD